MADEERNGTYIGGEWTKLTSERKTELPLADQIDIALERQLDRDAGINSEVSDYQPEPDERPNTFRNVEEAIEAMEEESETLREREEQREQNLKARAEKKVENSITEARDWHPNDQRIIQGLSAELQEHARLKQGYINALQLARQRPDLLNAENKRALQETYQMLSAREEGFQQSVQRVYGAAELKTAEANRRLLYKDFPELKDPSTRSELVEWAISEKGIPRDVAEGATDRAMVGEYYREFQRVKKAEREAWINRPRETRYIGEKMTVEEAHERLKETGSMDDAMNYLTLKEERDREAQ